MMIITQQNYTQSRKMLQMQKVYDTKNGRASFFSCAVDVNVFFSFWSVATSFSHFVPLHFLTILLYLNNKAFPWLIGEASIFTEYGKFVQKCVFEYFDTCWEKFVSIMKSIHFFTHSICYHNAIINEIDFLGWWKHFHLSINDAIFLLVKYKNE